MGIRSIPNTIKSILVSQKIKKQIVVENKNVMQTGFYFL
jgi:hypothetical protein